MTTAEQLAQTPDEDVQQILEHLPELSASSESEARCDRIYDDGSAITFTSREGGPVEVEVRVATDHEVEEHEFRKQAEANAPDA